MADQPDAIARVRLAASENGLTEGLDAAALAWLISTGEVETYSEGVSETLGLEQVRFTRRNREPNAEHHRAAARQAIDRGYWKAFALASSRQRPEIEAIRDAALDAIVATEVLVDIQRIGREAEQRLRSWRPGQPEAPLLPAPDALMSDYGPVGSDDAPYPGVPDDFVQLMTGDETLEEAVERMTLGVDELLDMATVLSDQSLELALCTIPPERVNEWTEKLISEKARLRRLRGTVDENFGRENLVSRVQGMFAQVGAKR